MHLSSFCHAPKVIFTIKIMRDNLFIHSECTGRELVFRIQSRTYITSKHKYHIYLRCLLEDLIPLLILLHGISVRDRALGSVLWKDLPSVLLTCSKRKAVEALSANSKEGTLCQWGNKKPNGRLPKPQHYFIWERFARMAGVLVPWRLEAEIKTRTLLSTGGRPRPSTKSPQLICGDQRQGKWGFLVLCNRKNMQRNYFLWISQDLVTFTYQNITGGSEEGLPSMQPHFEKAQFFMLPLGRVTWGFIHHQDHCNYQSRKAVNKITAYRKSSCLLPSVFTIILPQI